MRLAAVTHSVLDGAVDSPFDSGLSDTSLALLAIYREGAELKKPRQKLLDLIADEQPPELKALLHTCAHHGFFLQVGDYWFEASSFLPLAELPQLEDMEDEQMNGYARSHGVVFGQNAGGEMFLVATWKPGATAFDVALCVAGGYTDDGLTPLDGGWVGALRRCLSIESEKTGIALTADNAAEELTNNNQALLDLLAQA